MTSYLSSGRVNGLKLLNLALVILRWFEAFFLLRFDDWLERGSREPFFHDLHLGPIVHESGDLRLLFHRVIFPNFFIVLVFGSSLEFFGLPATAF